MSFHYGIDRLKVGDPGVGYGSDGRLTDNDTRGDPTPSTSYTSGWRQWLSPSAFERRYEWNGGPYGTPERDRDEMIVERKEREGLVVEDRLVYNERPRFWIIFILIGILLIVLGVLNLLFCLDFHWFSRFYAGVFILLLGILGLLHRGNYRSDGGKLKSVLYMVVGLIAAILLFLCMGLVVATFAHETIDITQFTPSGFIDITVIRIGINQESVIRNISSWETHIWMCYALDGITILVLLAGTLILASVVVVFDNYYNNNYTYIRQVEPFCEPMLFNPYGEVMLGQAMIFFGFVVSYSVYGNFRIEWQTYIPLVWTGIVPVVAGFFTAVALKRSHKQNSLWTIVAIVIQIIFIVVCVICAILLTIGLYENIVTFTENNTMNVTDYTVELLTASVLMFAIGDCLVLLGIFWAIALIIMLLRHTCSRYREQDVVIDHRAPERDNYPVKSRSTIEILRDHRRLADDKYPAVYDDRI